MPQGLAVPLAGGKVGSSCRRHTESVVNGRAQCTEQHRRGMSWHEGLGRGVQTNTLRENTHQPLCVGLDLLDGDQGQRQVEALGDGIQTQVEVVCRHSTHSAGIRSHV